MLYYGVLSCAFDVDVLAEPELKRLRAELRVERLHANQLGSGGLVQVLPQLLRLQRTLGLQLDIYRVVKADHAVICFFDQVFDAGLNPAMTWTGYWTPIRYVLLMKVSGLFDEELAKAAWAARISLDSAEASKQLTSICTILLTRVSRLPDARSREVIGDALRWAANNPHELYYNTKDPKARLQVMPNVVGFQSVIHGITRRIRDSSVKAKRIIVDQQSQFNKAQKSLLESYAQSREVEWELGPGLPKMDLADVPDVPLTFASGVSSCGLELVDVYLWICKRLFERKQVARELYALLAPHKNLSNIYEISLRAIQERWGPHIENLPRLSDLSEEQRLAGQALLAADEQRRRAAMEEPVVRQPRQK